jgi:hypothetical protein
MPRVTLLVVYREDPPRVILDAPANLDRLLEEWNRLDELYEADQAAGEAAGWEFVSDWLRARGVNVLADGDIDTVYLAECRTV